MITKKLTIIICIYTIIFVALVTYTTLPDENRKIITKTSFEKTVDVDRKKLFDLMANVEEYPKILPENFVSVSIINKTGNVIFAREVVQEEGIKVELLVKHMIVPYQQQVIEIVGGDANGTRITTVFYETNSQTKISAYAEMHMRGILLPFAYLPASNIHHAMNTALDKFVEYLKSENSK